MYAVPAICVKHSEGGEDEPRREMQPVILRAR